MEESFVENLRLLTLKLSLIKGVGPRKVLHIFNISSDLLNFYENIQTCFGKDLNYKDILPNLDMLVVNTEHPIEFVCFWEEHYPKSLLSIYDPPIVIFYVGRYSVESLERSFSVVGTRNISTYGLRVCKSISEGLSNDGFSVVSGLAFGVDKVAHNSCLDSNGYTVAVLASSPDICSPAGNFPTYDRILKQGGLVISECYPGSPVSKSSFVRRNRIVAGLSLGTIVVEAPTKSGALITANLAYGYGRQVFAVPGNVGSINSMGCNLLIKSSIAKLVESYLDVLAEFNIVDKKSGQKQPAEKVALIKNLNSNEVLIYNEILKSPKTFDELNLSVSIDVSKIYSSTANLEVLGLISIGDDGKYYII
jgi:DNA processing protein